MKIDRLAGLPSFQYQIKDKKDGESPAQNQNQNQNQNEGQDHPDKQGKGHPSSLAIPGLKTNFKKKPSGGLQSSEETEELEETEEKQEIRQFTGEEFLQLREFLKTLDPKR